MQLCLYTLGNKAAPGPATALISDYLARASRYLPCAHTRVASEAALLTLLEKKAARTTPVLILTDSRGKQLTSEEFAATLGGFQDSGAQHIAIAIGPPDGWSPQALQRANLTIAFGRITLPHELAAVVDAEQIYRAFTIRAGHPYHTGH